MFTYAALWIATYAIGGAQVRALTEAQLEIKPSYHRIPMDAVGIYQYPAYGYSVVSYAPFFVTARYMVWWSDEGAMFGTSIYFWYGIPSRPFRAMDGRV